MSFRFQRRKFGPKFRDRLLILLMRSGEVCVVRLGCVKLFRQDRIAQLEVVLRGFQRCYALA